MTCQDKLKIQTKQYKYADNFMGKGWTYLELWLEADKKRMKKVWRILIK